MDYLPEGYEELKTSKNYLSLSKLPEGEHRFRIVQRPIAGWIDWKEKKPYRYLPNKKPACSFIPEQPVRAFWTCYVWDYARSGLYIVEITQSSIIKSLAQFGKDADWGDFTKYDIKISKEGGGKDTKYHVSPVPHKPLAENIGRALLEAPVRLEALYEGLDPWSDLKDESKASKSAQSLKEVQYLNELIGDDKELRENIVNFLKKQGLSSDFSDLPDSMYEKIVARALRNKIEHNKNQKINTDDIGSTLIDMYGPIEAGVLPF
jgi:hypothetical protein